MSTDDDRVPDLHRLPRSVVPKRYELRLSLEPEARLYTGEVHIRVVVHEDQIDTVWLHATDFEVHEASIRFSHFSLPSLTSELVWVKRHECLGLRFPFKMDRGSRGWLTLKFSGSIKEEMQGLFALPFKNKEGEMEWGVATMFAATKARSCFPCFDEPDLKAVFALELTVPSHLMSISNMGVMDSRLKESSSTTSWSSATKRRRQVVPRRTDYFHWTREMSTYLLCFVVADFEYLERRTSDSRSVLRIYTPWGQRERGRFALEVAQRSLEYFNEYFGVRYPLDKLDLVAVSRLSVGAMENWGLIVARESAIITKDELEMANPENLQTIAMLVAHEVSHQWFGDLVTMQWWDALYLNEGFATLMQYLCVDALYPHLNALERFCADTVLPALGLDALRHSHPIQLRELNNVDEAFDNITYCKGASVLFMVHEYLGRNVFNKAIREYMELFAYDNACSQDLWYELSAASRKDVGRIMHNWINLLGFPLIHVDVKMDNDPKESKSAGVLRLQQRRFASQFEDNEEDSNGNDEEEPIWHVPLKISYCTTKGTVNRLEHLLESEEAEMSLDADFDMSHKACWLKVDSSITGFYRVHYSDALLRSLIAHLQDLEAMDRVALFSDLLALGLDMKDEEKLDDKKTTVISNSSLVLDMVERLSVFETSHLVLKTVITVLRQIRAITWVDRELADALDKFCLEVVVRPQLSRLGCEKVKGESHGDTMLRPLVFQMAAELNDDSVLRTAKTLFEVHVSKEKHSLSASMKEAVYSAVMSLDLSESMYEQLIKLYEERSELAEDRNVILKALGRARDSNQLQRAFHFALFNSNVQPQDAVATLMSAATTRSGHREVWIFFQNNLDALIDRYSSGLFLFDRLLQAVTETLNRDEDVEELKRCFETRKTDMEVNQRAVDQALERVRLNTQWRLRESQHIRAFMNANGFL